MQNIDPRFFGLDPQVLAQWNPPAPTAAYAQPAPVQPQQVLMPQLPPQVGMQQVVAPPSAQAAPTQDNSLGALSATQFTQALPAFGSAIGSLIDGPRRYHRNLSDRRTKTGVKSAGREVDNFLASFFGVK